MKSVAIDAPVATANMQSTEVFAEQQSRLESAPRTRWIAPSDGDPDVIADILASETDANGLLSLTIELGGGRVRGILLHKLMEELITGELPDDLEAASARAALLYDQLLSLSSSNAAIEAFELATTALATLRLPEIEPYRSRLVAEVPIHATTRTSAYDLIAGRADAIAQTNDGDIVAFDWKSDIAPDDADRSAYRQQLAQYLRAIGARKGAVVYMTVGHLDWITIAP